MHPTKDTLALLLGVLNSSLYSAKELKWRLLGAYCGAKVDSIGPWSTPEAKISFEIIRTGFENYFPKIEQLIGSIKLHIEKLVPKYDKVKDILIQLPPREFSQNREWELPMPLIPCFNPSCDLFKAKQQYQDEFKRIPAYVEEGVFFTFKCLHTLDELQLDSLLSPKPSYSKTPTFEENRRNLVKWKKWAKTLDKYKYHRYLPNLNYKFKK